MKLTVSKQELQDRLSNIQNIVEKRNTMPILSHFLLDVRKKGAQITATDIETAIREPMEVSAEKEGKLCIPARKLFEIVREVDGDISIEAEDSQWIRVSAGHSSFRLASLAPEEFPAWPKLEDATELELDSPVLGQMIEKTIYASGESDTRYTLNGLLFNLSGGVLTVVGTDGHRMAVIERQMAGAPEGGEIKVIVPKKTTSELRKFLDAEGKVKVLVGRNHILFRIGDVEFLARLIEGTYPNYRQVIPSGNEKKLQIGREALTKALRRVSVMSRERSNAIKVELEPGLLRLSSSNPDLGEARDEVAVDYKGEALAVGFNARYLLDVLQAMTAESVVFELQDQLSPTLLREAGDESYRCVVMPMRI
ncbi:MAG: DNA polymerase III subunit beta [Thermodesulfovibrionales bacterium]